MRLGLYAIGIACAAAGGFLIPLLGLSCVGFLPLAAGCVWAAYDIVDTEVGSGVDAAKPPK